MSRTQVLSNEQETIATASSANSANHDLRRAKGYNITAQVTVTTPTAKTFTANTTGSIFTATAHGFLTGLKLQVSNSGGALPSGLSAVTDYFVIPIDANTFKLATSLANAKAGTNLTITTNGTGTQTATPTAIAGGTAQLAGSTDGLIPYVVVTGTSQNITATGNLQWDISNRQYSYVQVQYTLTAGQISVVQNTLTNGES